MNDPLTRAAILAGTDKFGYHDYTPNYFKMFAHLKDAPIKVLEIGVGGYADDDRGGQSLEVWRDFFPKAEVTGIDIQKKTMDLGPRVKILQGSQVDPDFLKELVAKRGPFDIIIDDGSHRNEHIVASYQMLFPTLNAGGIYVAEDVQTSFHPRFGGSLDMVAPNSVGYFGNLLRNLGAPSDDPLIADVAGMERYHNMIAIHKKQAGQTPDIFDSSRFRIFTGTAANVHCIGGKVTKLPITTGKITTSAWTKTAAPSVRKNTDLLICTTDGTRKFSKTMLETLFSSVRTGGIMVIRSTKPGVDFAPDSPLSIYAQHRFIMVDHIEMQVHYPKAEIDKLAAQIYSVERVGDAVLFYKSPNTFPSNFAYDPANAQASAALDHMENVLKDATSEGGLVQYADILTRYRSREDARATLAKLADLGATSRQYYQMAGGLAQRDKRLDDAIGIFATALEKFPHDPQFTCMLAAAHTGLRQDDKAEKVLRAALAVYPRARALVGSLSRHLVRIGELEEARTLVESTITLFPHQMRPARLLMLAQIARQQGDLGFAEDALETAHAAAPRDAMICQEYSKLMYDKADVSQAVDFAAMALSLAPENPRIQAHHATLAS